MKREKVAGTEDGMVGRMVAEEEGKCGQETEWERSAGQREGAAGKVNERCGKEIERAGRN